LAASRALRFHIVALGVFALTNCAPTQPAAPAPPLPVVPAAVLEPARYMEVAASSALFAVRASDMAEARGSTAKLKRFASKVVMDQTSIGTQLSFAGRHIDLLPSARPLPVHQAMLEELATSSDFDGTYRRQLMLVLTQAEALHRAFEAHGTSPTLRPVAAMAAPVCRKNLDQLGKIRA